MKSYHSFLFVPATRADAYLKKLSSSPQSRELPYAVIFDLEDSIHEQYKHSAREMLHRAIAEYFDTCSDLFRWHIRINDCSSRFFSEDLKWLRSLVKYPIGIKLPKCRNREDVIAVEEFHSESVPMIPTIETLQGYGNRDTIMAHARQIGVKYVGFGAGDMALELGVEREYTLPVFRHVICELIIAAKRHGLNLIDSISRVLPKGGQDWQSLVATEAAFSCANGFAAKKAIHPAQVPLIERAFNPEEKTNRARQVLEDLDNQNPTRAVRSSETGDYVGTPSMKHASKVLQACEMREGAQTEESAQSS